MTVSTLMTADELLELPEDGWRYELVRGELKKMSPTGADHGSISALIIISLGMHVTRTKAGTVYASETGFRLSRNPDTVLAPDVAFVRVERAYKTSKYFEGPPDAAFEIVSPGDTYSEVEAKTAEWLRGGTRVVVIADPRTKSVRVHRESGVTNVVEELAIEEVLPGWRMTLSEIFG